jgi:hypothetical protein
MATCKLAFYRTDKTILILKGIPEQRDLRRQGGFVDNLISMMLID